MVVNLPQLNLWRKNKLKSEMFLKNNNTTRHSYLNAIWRSVVTYIFRMGISTSTLFGDILHYLIKCQKKIIIMI
mgnify:CR=1 FL=1